MLNQALNIEYTTSSKNTYPLELGFSTIKSNDIIRDKKVTDMACKKGCNLYGKNGGCPPFSPSFEEVCGLETLLIYLKIQTKNYPDKVLNGPSYYTKWVFVETFMTTLTNKIGKEISKISGGYFLSSGNCHGCRPKRCAVKDGRPCRNKEARTFSLESTGVFVEDALQKAFGFGLQWWIKDDPNVIPKYMVKSIGVTNNAEFDQTEVRKGILDFLKLNKITIL